MATAAWQPDGWQVAGKRKAATVCRTVAATKAEAVALPVFRLPRQRYATHKKPP